MKTSLIALVLCLVAATGCATPPKPVTAYISVDEAYPVFNLQKPGNPGNVSVPATKEQIARWKAAAAAYAKAQAEMEAAVSHYEPLAIKKRVK